MDRKELLKKISLVSPALGRGDLLPQLAYLWFNGENVLAFDDNVAIQTACDFDLEGGVRGDLFQKALDRSLVKEANFKMTNKGINLTLGPARYTFAVMDAGNVPFVMPKTGNAHVEYVGDGMKTALAHCIKSIGYDVTHPEWYGVTLQPNSNKSMYVFSGYEQVLVRATVDVRKAPKFKRVVLHQKFCEQLLKHIKSDLSISDEAAMFLSEDVIVFGRPLQSDSTLDLNAMANKVLGSIDDDAWVPLPKIDMMLSRANLFEAEHLNMTVAVVNSPKGSRIEMRSGSAEGELVDHSAPLAKKHKEIEVQTNVKHLHNGAGLAEFVIMEDAIVLRNDKVEQIISVK